MHAAKRRQREKLERRAQIMDAAERVFVNTSVRQATMDQIARAASVSKGSLYLYFKDKEDLYLSIAERAVSDLIEREEAVKLRMQGCSGYDWFEAALRCYVEYVLEYRDRFRVAMSWLSGESPVTEDSPGFSEYQRGFTKAFQFPYEAVELGKLDGSVRADLKTPPLLFSVWGGLVGMLLMLSNPGEVMRRLPFDVDFDQALERHIQMVLGSIRANSLPQLEQSGIRIVSRKRDSGRSK